MLLVLYNNERVGKLWGENRVLHFRYEEKWLKTKNSFPLSPRLPLNNRFFAGDEVVFFFSNLLPEGPILASLLKLKHLPIGDVYAQLEAFGEDAAGAFAVVPESQGKQRKPSYESYPLRALRADLERLKQNQPLLIQHLDLRLSLAGVQNKIAVKYEKGKFWLPAGGAASTHILKPAIQPEREFANSVLNEALCLRLARLSGLDAAEAEVVRLPQPVLLIKRYDRQWNQNKIIRLHQLDFCQLAGVLPDQKYEKDGGPSISTLFALIDEHARLAGRDRLKLIDWVIFNYLIGNADAHGKNLAMLVEPSGRLSLAPAYDLLCTAVYPNLDARMAMAIGGEYRPEWVRTKNWKQFSENVHINPSLLKKRSRELAKRTINYFSQAVALLENKRALPITAKIKRIIIQRARWLETNQEGM